MITASPANLPYYLRFIERYASLAYAIAFSETGDFFEAQNLIERSFAQGYPIWSGRFPGNRDSEDTLQKILRRHLPERPSEFKPGANVASFAQSRKLLENQEAQALLLGFTGLNRLALFLEIVEEMPRHQAARLLGRPLEAFEDAHADLEQAVKKWRPDDPQAMELFTRTLRQYRLPPGFLSTIEGKMDFSWKRSFNPTAVVRNGLIALGVVVVIIGVSSRRRAGPFEVPPAVARYDDFGRPVAFVRDMPGSLTAGAGNLLLWIDLMMLAALLALKRGLERHEGEGMVLAGEFEHPLTSLSVLHTFGVIVVSAGVVNFIWPTTFQESWVPIAYVASHALFLPLAAAGMMRVLLRLLLQREVRS